MSDLLVVRRLERGELGLVSGIDRTERIDALYVQDGSRLEVRPGDFSASAWNQRGRGEHSVTGQRRALEAYLDGGGVAVGAFDGDRLVGIGAVVPGLRPGVAQLAYLHVSDGFRSRGVGGRLASELERIARQAGGTELVVSATPSRNTVDFYRRRGFEPTGEPLPELYELEPEDVHMRKSL